MDSILICRATKCLCTYNMHHVQTICSSYHLREQHAYDSANSDDGSLHHCPKIKHFHTRSKLLFKQKGRGGIGGWSHGQNNAIHEKFHVILQDVAVLITKLQSNYQCYIYGYLMHNWKGHLLLIGNSVDKKTIAYKLISHKKTSTNALYQYVQSF